MIDAARHIGGEHQQQIDLLGGPRERSLEENQRGERESQTREADHDCVTPICRPGLSSRRMAPDRPLVI